MSLASTSLRSLTVLTQDDGVPGSKFENDPENYTVDQLKRWLKCRGLKLSGKRDDLVKRVAECIQAGKHHTLDPSIDEGKWFAAKVIKENFGLQQNSNVVSLPDIPSKGWRDFPSYNIPQLFNYGHIHYYVLESIRNVNASEDDDEGLGHMTDKPLKNGRKYVDSGFVHDLMDTVTAEHYLVRAHVWPSMRGDLPHNVVVVLSLNSGAVIHASCEPCRVSSLGRCSHVVAVLFTVLDHTQKHGYVASKPCTSQECSWNKGKKRNKTPQRLSQATYDSKLKKAAVQVIDFDPRPAKYRVVTPEHINRFVIDLQSLSQNGNGNISMWETQLKITYSDYDLTDEQSKLLSEKVTVFLKNITPESCGEIEGTEQQSLSEKWFSERWYRVTASECLSAFKIGRMILQSQPNVALEAFKFICKSIWKIDAEPFQTYWMRYGLASEAKAIEKYERAFNVKVRRCGLWVNPKFPFLGCSPDGLVDDDTVVEIKALKLLKEYSVEQITSATSVVPKHVLKRQCFVVKDGKCVLQRSHSYYYQCQHILLVTERKSCVFILYAESGPDSVEKITRDEALITKILEYIQALWMRVIAPEIFEMRAPRDLLPFILPESPSSEPVTHCDTGTPASLPASASFDDPSEPVTHCDTGTPASSPASASFDDPREPATHCDTGTPTSLPASASFEDPCEPVTHCDTGTPTSVLYTSYSQDEIQAAEALLCSCTTHEKPLASPAQELTVFPWGGMTSNGVLLSNTCPLDNWLMIFQALVKSDMVNLADLHESGQTIATALRLIECGQYADAKLLIIQSLQHPHQGMSRHFFSNSHYSPFFKL